MKKLLLLLLTGITLTFYATGQDSIWFENFSLPDSTTSDNGETAWMLSDSIDSDNNYVASIQDSAFLVQNVYGSGLNINWRSEWIRIDSFYNINWSFDVWRTDGSNSADYFQFFINYASNGNFNEVKLIDDGGGVDNSSPSDSIENMFYDSIQLRVYADPRTRNYWFDNFTVSGEKKTNYPTVTINVKNQSGNNLSGKDVIVDHYGTLTTDASGNVSFVAPAPVDNIGYAISQDVDGYKAIQDSFQVAKNATDFTINVVLDTAYSVTFNVVDDQVGNPVSGATVSLDGYGDSLTNASGSVTYYDIAVSDSIYYSISKNGFANYSDSIQIADNDITENITLLTAYDVNITVMDKETLTPVDGISVTLDGYGSVITDNTGTATFLKVLASDSIYYETAMTPIFSSGNDSVSVSGGAVYDTLLLSYASDTIIWYENFNIEQDAKIDSGITAWSTSGSVNTGITGDGELRLENVSDFLSEKIAVDSMMGLPVDAINIHIGIVERWDNGYEGPDHLLLKYRMDNGSIDTLHDQQGSLPTENQIYTFSAYGVTGDTLEVLMNTTSNAESFFISSIMVSVATSNPTATITPADASIDISLDTIIKIAFDQPVRNLDDSEITDPASRVTLKETDASGADVAFSATINATADTITVTPDNQLTENTVYYVAIDGVENKWNLGINTTSASFTTKDIVSIDEVDAIALEVYPNPASDVIYVKAPVGSTVSLINMLGATVSKTNTTSQLSEIPVDNISGQIAIVKINTGSEEIIRKVMIK